MRRRLPITLAALSVIGVATGAVPAFSDDAGTLHVTITAQAPNATPCILISDTSLSVGGIAATPAQSRVTRLEGFTVTNCGSAATVEARATDATGAAGTWALADYPRGNPVENVCELGPNRFAAWIGMAARQSGDEGGVYLKTQDQPFLDPADEATPFVFPAGDVADGFLQVAMPCVGSLGLGDPMTTQITLTAVAP
jgi:hypothetical protein